MLQKRSSEKVLVTGGCGFIGRHLVEALLGKGISVKLLDRDAQAIARNPNPAVEYVFGSVSDERAVAQAMEGCNGVYHLAAVSTVGQCEEAPDDCHATNVKGSAIIFQLAGQMGKIPVVYASSAAIYGQSDSPLSESHVPQPQNLYGTSKLHMEQSARRSGLELGTPNFGLRLFNIFGPGLDATSRGVISAFVSQVRSGVPVTVHGDGLQQRDFVYVKDGVEHMIVAMQKAHSSSPIANVCSGEGTTMMSLISIVSELTGKRANIEYQPSRNFDVRYSVGKPALARQLLNIAPRTRLRDGLAAKLQDAKIDSAAGLK